MNFYIISLCILYLVAGKRMGFQEKKSQTELGIKYVYHYFILAIILNLFLTIYALFLFLQGVNLIEFSNSNISFLFIEATCSLF